MNYKSKTQQVQGEGVDGATTLKTVTVCKLAHISPEIWITLSMI
jgi:hypothetical protein